ELAVMRVPPVAATPEPGLSMTEKALGGLNPSLGSMATIFGYHSASNGASFCWAHSLSSGAAEVSIVISHEPSAVRVTKGGAAAASAATAGLLSWALITSISL